MNRAGSGLVAPAPAPVTPSGDCPGVRASSTSNFFKAALESREFICTTELVLGRDHTTGEAETFIQQAAQQADGIKVISITDLPGGHPALPPEAFVSYVLEHALTPLAHLTGKDGNRSFIEARLHEMAHLRVENILALTGDAQKEGFEGRSKPVYDLDSVLILWLIRSLSQGLEYTAGSKTLHTTPARFYAGAVVNPYKVRQPDLMMQLYKLQLKIAAGAEFVITQLGYNLRKLYELKQFMDREDLGHIPVLANVYVPTARVAQMMKAGEIAGCVVTDSFIRKLELEKKPQRLERAALMVAAAKDLGFAGAHIGGFGLTASDALTIRNRAYEIGTAWRARMDELIFPLSGEFYLLPQGSDGLSDSSGPYQVARAKPQASFLQRLSAMVHRHFIQEGSFACQVFQQKLASDRVSANWRRGIWYRLLEPSSAYRKATLGCVSCGDCLQDHFNYAGCSMRWCYKELRNGPCGGSRIDGTCEARPEHACVWNQIYVGTLAAGDDPRKFGHVLVPPRDWCLDKTNALANRFAGLDNLRKRIDLAASGRPVELRKKGQADADYR
jgi:methylenetetrahydrofolate reductase (NADH)